jgi:hypothetical protein
MTSAESLYKKSLTSWLVKPLGWMLATFKFFIRFVPLIWATAAIYWSNLPWGWTRLMLALAFLGFGVYALWVKPNLRTLLVFAGLFLVVFAWYLSIRPSNNRNWRPEVAVSSWTRSASFPVRLRLRSCVFFRSENSSEWAATKKSVLTFA